MSQVRYIFLSHNSVDKPDVEALAEKLEKHSLAKDHNIQVWLDKNNLGHGAYTDQFAKAIRNESTCAFLLFVPSEEIRGYVKHEIQIAFNRKMNDDKDRKVFPILPVYPEAASDRLALPDPLSDHQYREHINTDDSHIESILKDVVGAVIDNQKVDQQPEDASKNTSKHPETAKPEPTKNHTFFLPLEEQWLC